MLHTPRPRLSDQDVRQVSKSSLWSSELACQFQWQRLLACHTLQKEEDTLFPNLTILDMVGSSLCSLNILGSQTLLLCSTLITSWTSSPAGWKKGFKLALCSGLSSKQFADLQINSHSTQAVLLLTQGHRPLYRLLGTRRNVNAIFVYNLLCICQGLEPASVHACRTHSSRFCRRAI